MEIVIGGCVLVNLGLCYLLWNTRSVVGHNAGCLNDTNARVNKLEKRLDRIAKAAKDETE